MPTRQIQSASVVAVAVVVVAVVQRMVQHWKVRISNKKVQKPLNTLLPQWPLRKQSPHLLLRMLHTKHLRTVHLPHLPHLPLTSRLHRL